MCVGPILRVCGQPEKEHTTEQDEFVTQEERAIVARAQKKAGGGGWRFSECIITSWRVGASVHCISATRASLCSLAGRRVARGSTQPKL